MNEQKRIQDNQIQQIASSFKYPPTPNISRNVSAQLQVSKKHSYARPKVLAWAVLLIIFLMVGLLSVPQVRAAALRFFNIGAITIFEQPVENTAVLNATKPATPLIEQLGIVTEISLAEAQNQSDKAYYLPANLGQPDHIYLYDDTHSWPPTAIISVWQTEASQLALYQIEAPQFAYKGATTFEETAVNGQRAMWITSSHPFQLQNNQWQEWQFVEGNVLIWWHEDGITFRLEGAKSLEEAMRMAESVTKMED